jgi:hypothetical protein
LNFFKRYRILHKANYLDLVPVRLHPHEVNDDGRVKLIVPKFRNAFFSKWFIPKGKSPDFRIKLDELGSATWMAIDGQSTVRNICQSLESRFGETIHPAEQRITKFMTLLYDQRYITFREIMDEKKS